MRRHLRRQKQGGPEACAEEGKTASHVQAAGDPAEEFLQHALLHLLGSCSGTGM
jgi:hypothetical protein